MTMNDNENSQPASDPLLANPTGSPCVFGLDLEDLKALKQLGMKCLVMTHYGEAFANEFMLKLNDGETGWMQDTGYNPFASSLSPKKLNGYCENWKKSLVDIDSI